MSQIPILRFIIPDLSGYSQLMQVMEKLWRFIGDEIDKHEIKIREGCHKAENLIDALILEMINAENDPKARTLSRKSII